MSTDQEGFISIFGFGNNTRFKAIPDELFFGSDYTPEDEIVTNNETRNFTLVNSLGYPYGLDIQKLLTKKVSITRLNSKYEIKFRID